jgi:hypothetical protein
MIGEGEPLGEKRFPATWSDWKVAISTLLIDFALIFPVIVPYFLIDTVRWAVFAFHAIAIILLATVAIILAGYLGLNRLEAGLIIVLISLVMIYSTYAIGW